MGLFCCKAYEYSHMKSRGGATRRPDFIVQANDLQKSYEGHNTVRMRGVFGNSLVTNE